MRSFSTRRVIPKTFRLSLVYLTEGDTLYVVALAPFKRRPGYWRQRLGEPKP